VNAVVLINSRGQDVLDHITYIEGLSDGSCYGGTSVFDDLKDAITVITDEVCVCVCKYMCVCPCMCVDSDSVLIGFSSLQSDSVDQAVADVDFSSIQDQLADQGLPRHQIDPTYD
jgi:hypothetical protein